MFEIDWRQAPRGAKWWAINADGQAHWFTPPKPIPFAHIWYADMDPAPDFGYQGDWKDSLHECPAKLTTVKRKSTL